MSTVPRKSVSAKDASDEKASRRSVLFWLSGVALAGSGLISAVSNFVFMRPRAI